MRRRSWAWRTAAVISGCALLLGVAGCGDDSEDAGATTGGGDGAAEVELTLAYVTTQQHPYGQAVDFFIDEVNTASGGRIKVTGLPSYPNPEPQLLSDVRAGSVEMGTISTAIWDSAGINSFQALQAPFLVSNYGLEGQILNGELGTAMAEDASSKAGDIVVLTVHEGGLRKPLGSKKKFTNPASFKGSKIRAPGSKVLAEGLQALGAEADPLPLPEVYQALKNGTVDGMEANLGLIATNKYYEVAKYVTGNVNFWPFPTALTINKETFDALSAEDQKILTDAAAKVPAKSLEIVSAPSQLPQALVDCGIEFVTATDADRAALAKAAETAVAALSSADSTTADFIKQIQDLKASAAPPAAPPPFPTKKSAPDAKCTLGG